jgi:hypothetical protein
MPHPLRCSAPITRNNRSDSSPVSAAVGSSMTNRRAGAAGSSRKVDAILTSMRSPTGSRAMIALLATCVTPSASSAARARACSLRQSTRPPKRMGYGRPRKMFSATLSCGTMFNS